MRPIVSIIVPIYNAQKYIQECIESVVKQSFTKWELLLIDDGSIDDSYDVCNAFSREDIRINVIRKHNSGVSATRNLGLDLANGEYVIFLDADDYWCDTTFLEKLVGLAEMYSLDIVRGEYKAITEKGIDIFQPDISDERYRCSNKVIDSATFVKAAISGEFFLVLSLLRKSAIGSLRLNVGQIFLEDMRFYSQMLQNPLRCMYVPIRFYAYRKNTASVSFKFNLKKLEDSFDMCDFFHECAHDESSIELRAFYNYYSVMMYKWTLETMALDGYYEMRHSIIKELRLVDLYHRVSSWVKSEHINVCELVLKVKPLLGIFIFRLKGKLREWYTIIREIN